MARVDVLQFKGFLLSGDEHNDDEPEESAKDKKMEPAVPDEKDHDVVQRGKRDKKMVQMPAKVSSGLCRQSIGTLRKRSVYPQIFRGEL